MKWLCKLRKLFGARKRRVFTPEHRAAISAGLKRHHAVKIPPIAERLSAWEPKDAA
jgi:hypothetical protein